MRTRTAGGAIEIFDLDGFERDLLLDFLDQRLHKRRVAHLRQNKIGVRALRELQQFIDHVADALDLFADAHLGHLARGHRRGRLAGHVGRDADDVEGILQIVDDRAGKTADQLQSFRLEHFPDVLVVEHAHPPADVPQQRRSQARHPLQPLQQFPAADEIDRRRLIGRRVGGARPLVQHRHFPEKIPRPRLGKHLRIAAVHAGGNQDPSFLDEVNAVARITLAEDRLARGIVHLPRRPRAGAPIPPPSVP